MVKELQLPMSRIKTIMKSSPDVESIGQDALYVVTKATELFVQHMAQEAYSKNKSTQCEYKQLAEIVQNNENMSFLREILPRKITVKEYRKLLAADKENNAESEDSSD